MENVMEETAVMQKTLELCQTILDDPSIKSMRDRIDAFMDDEKTRSQYEDLVNKGNSVAKKSTTSKKAGERCSPIRSLVVFSMRRNKCNRSSNPFKAM
jgi:hypothetical protein